MFGWTILVSALLLVEIGIAAPVDERFEHISKERNELKTRLEDIYADVGRYCLKEIRALIQIVLEDPKATEKFTGVIKEYQDFLEETKNFETASKEELLKYFHKGTSFFPNHETIEEADWSKYLLLQKYDTYIAMDENTKMKYFKFIENFGYQVREYLNKLTDDEKKIEAHMVFWYDRWTHERDFIARKNLVNDFFQLYVHPMQSSSLYNYMLAYSFVNYTKEFKEIVEGVHEEKFVNEINSVIGLYDFKNPDIFIKMAQFYKDFNEWLLSKGPTYFQSKRAAFRSTIKFFDNIDFYTELYLRYSDDETHIRDWYKDLKETDNFKESFDKYFKLFSLLYSQSKEIRVTIPM